MANDNIAVLLFTCWKIIKLYYSIKLTRSNLFRLYFIKRNNGGGGGLMERYLSEVIGNKLTLYSPPLLIPEFIIYLLIKPMFGVFTIAMKFDSLFLDIF